jgi:hypothetical protein
VPFIPGFAMHTGMNLENTCRLGIIGLFQRSNMAWIVGLPGLALDQVNRANLLKSEAG